MPLWSVILAYWRGKWRGMRDRRLFALLFTAALVIAGGLVIALWPDKSGRPVGGTEDMRVKHVQEKTEDEIKQRFDEGVGYLKSKEYENALKSFHRVLELDPDMPEAHANAGFALIGLERYAVAREFFEGAIALNKNQLNAYYGLAVARAGANDLQGAVEAMNIYMHLSPPDDRYREKAMAALALWEVRLSLAVSAAK